MWHAHSNEYGIKKSEENKQKTINNKTQKLYSGLANCCLRPLSFAIDLMVVYKYNSYGLVGILGCYQGIMETC